MGILNDIAKRDLTGRLKKEDWIGKLRKLTGDELYFYNKKMKVGETCVCPVCKEAFTKKQYSQAFCSGECKDKFYNKKKKGTRNDYYARYNREHPERLERIGIYIDQSS